MRPLRTKALWVVAVLLALNAVLVSAQFAGAVPRGLSQYFFGPKLVRLEAVVREGGETKLYRVDKGRIRAVRPQLGTITLLERDGTLVVIPVAPDADIAINRRSVPLGALRRNMVVTTVRLEDAPAELVLAHR